MIAFERRASSILFGVLCARTDRRPILLPGNVCQIVPRTYEAAGHEFDLVDISAKTLSMDENECLDRIKTKKFAGVHFVRAYGSERSPESFFAELRSIQPDILIIDDKCLCLPDCDGESLSALADVTLFSTRYAKFVDIGTGGFAYLVDELPYHRAARGPEWLELEQPVWCWDDYCDLVRLANHRAIAHKSELNRIYSAAIPSTVQYPEHLQQWRFNIRVRNSEQLLTAIFSEGLFASRHHAPIGRCPIAETVHGATVNLFNDRYFTAEQARRTAAIVARHVANLG